MYQHNEHKTLGCPALRTGAVGWRSCMAI